MTPAARIRRTSIALAALLSMAALAAPALAGNRAAPGGCDDTQPKPKSGPGYENAAGANATSGKRENTSVGPTEDGYVPLSRTAIPTVSPAPRPADAGSVPVLAPRSEKPKTARKADAPAAASARAKKAAPAPAKVSIPNLPATPGMGTLLRVGITAGREIS